MNTPMSIVNEFLDITNNKHDIAGAVELMASDIHFVEPVMELNGAQEYGKITEHRIYYDPREFMTAFGMQ